LNGEVSEISLTDENIRTVIFKGCVIVLHKHDTVAVTPFEVKILPLSKSFFLLFASFDLLEFFTVIEEVTQFRLS